MRIMRTAGAALVAVALATGVAACGSDDEATTNAEAPAAEATTTAAPTGPAFNLGAICSCSGAQSAALKDLKQVSEAWAADVNARGGINGRPVKITVVDDGGTAATALRQVKELVETHKVQAIVGNGSLQDSAWASYVDDKGVPVIGGLANSAPFITDPNFIASGAGLPMVLVGMTQIAADAGKKTFGVMYCAETPICAQVVPLAQGAVQLAGIGLESVKVSGSAPSYAAPCLALKEKGVDAIYVAHNAEVVQRILQACAQQGFKPAITADAATVAKNWFDDPLFEGAFVSAPNANLDDTSNPAVAEFRAALAEHAPEVNEGDMPFPTTAPWASGKLFEAIAAAGNLTPDSTPAEVRAAAPKATGTDLGGFAPPLPIVKDRPVFSPCYFTMKIEGGKFVSTNEGKPTCLPEEQATSFATALAESAG